MLASLARFAIRRRHLMVFGIWIPIAIVIAGFSGSIGSAFNTSMSQPNSESQQANDLLQSVNKNSAGVTSQIVFKATTTIDDPVIKKAITAALQKVSALKNIDVNSPYDFPNQVSPTRTIAFAQLNVPREQMNQFKIIAQKVQDATSSVASSTLQVEYGGQLFDLFPIPESEALGILAAILILVLAFGSIIAMGLPIGLAIIGLIIASSTVSLVSHVVQMPDAATSMVAMIGLGVGIDYALFIVTRYREGIHDGLTMEEAIVESIDTSGRAVIFAGITVIIALLGLLSIGLSFVSGFAIAMAIGVAIMLIASITLLPSLIALAGTRIETTTTAGLISLIAIVGSALIAVLMHSAPIAIIGLVVGLLTQLVSFAVKPLRRPLPHRAQNNHKHSVWYRWSRVVQRRPWLSLVSAVVILGTLSIPMFSMRLGFGDFGNKKEDSTVRKAYDLIAEGFGPGANGPLFIAVTGEAVTNKETLTKFVKTLNSTHNVAFAGAMPLQSDKVALVTVYPKSAPQDEATTDLVHLLRDKVIPSSKIEAKVGGFTAGSVDFSDYLAGRLPLLIGVVLVLSFLLLMAVFRSVLVPLKAVLMNLLSVGSAYGIIVAIFQWGWFANILGIGKPGPIEAWAPMFLFAIVFGLSMDYEVFLLSRMKEEYDRTGDNGTAVADGLAATSRVITAAALIMVCVFAAFALGDDRQLKLFGLGMAVAIFIDASIVRMLLVPATMELLGARNWWIPAWLDRVLPKIDVEGRHHEGHVIS